MKDRRKSFWNRSEIPGFNSLKENTSCDVCVVGGGIAGITTAYLLAREGLSVVLLEAQSLASGQTSRTTAHLSSVQEYRLKELIHLHGQKKTTQLIQAHQRAIDLIETLVKTEKTQCAFARTDGYLFLGGQDELSVLEEELTLARKCGLPKAERVNTVPLLKNKVPGVRFPNQARFDPLLYLAALVRAASTAGVRFYENSQVTALKTEGDQPTAVVNASVRVQAKSMVVATHAPINSRFLLPLKQSAYRTYVIGFEIQPGLPIDSLWDTADPYHYIRAHDGIMMVGGSDHKTGQLKPGAKPFEHLEAWARDHLNGLGDARFKWSGQVMEPADALGFIGEYPGSQNTYVISGESGLGMTYSTLGASLVTDLIMKRPNELKKLFCPSRITAKAAPELVRENANSVIQYVDWVKPSKIKSLDDLAPDSGTILTEGTKKIAAYKDADGEVHQRCAVCPHLGALVRWNPLEKTWDCPCHGSRFNPLGKVIDGPAYQDLKKI